MTSAAKHGSLKFGIPGRWSPGGFGLLVALLVALTGPTGALAATDPGCTTLGGDDTTVPGECQISGTVGPVSGTIDLGETLHVLSGGTIRVAPAGVTINITSPSGDFVMETGSLIDGNACPKAADIKVALSGGDIDLKTGATIRSNGILCSGGVIEITTLPPGNADVDALVESFGSIGGVGGGNQPPGGGPITIKACTLNVSPTGVVSSRGADAGADLVHLEGCVVTILGRVESTGAGHGVPTNPANSCSDAPTNSPRRINVTRPGKPLDSTGCVEIWSGTTILIDSTGSNKGEVNADIGISGGTAGRGWIDILANQNIEIRDGAGNARTVNFCGANINITFAVHANGGLCQTNDQGGLILVQSYKGDVIASGDALQADAISAGSAGGEIRVEAQRNVNFTPLNLPGANIFARGDFTAGGGFGIGGKIGPSISSDLSLPAGAAPIRAFTGLLSWTAGTGDARPTGSAVPVLQRGEINLRACAAAGGVSVGALPNTVRFPVNGLNVPPYPTVTNDAVCGGAPTAPSYVTNFPLEDCVNVCQGGPDTFKSGTKFHDLNSNGVRDAGEPGLQGWIIHIFGTTATGLPVHEHVVTDANGFYKQLLGNGTYTACEELQPGWTQTSPNTTTSPKPANDGNLCETHTPVINVGDTMGAAGYTFTISDAHPQDTDDDFGNALVPGQCPENVLLAPKMTRCVIDAATATLHPTWCGLPASRRYTTVGAAASAAGSGEVIAVFINTTENVVLDGDKSLTIAQCALARVTAANRNQPVWTLNSVGQLTVIGADAVGGTIGWLVQNGPPTGHDVRGVRASGASLYGIQVTGNNHKVTWNSVNNNGVGINVSGNTNDLRGGTVSTNFGDGIQISGSNNSLQGATTQSNTGNGVMISGTNNTIRGNKANKNSGCGFLTTGALTTPPTSPDATGNKFNSNASNASAPNGTSENTKAEYCFGVPEIDQGSNKADNLAVPTAAKCPTLFSAGGNCE